jgi:hypothetical protein
MVGTPCRAISKVLPLDILRNKLGPAMLETISVVGSILHRLLLNAHAQYTVRGMFVQFGKHVIYYNVAHNGGHWRDLGRICGSCQK